MSEQNHPAISHRLGTASLLLMFIPAAVIFVMNLLILPAVGKIPTQIERLLLFIFMFLPPLTGLILAATGLARRESRKWLHIIALIGNSLQTLYFGVFLLLAG